MSKSQEYVFVLWGDKFDETAATIFVTEMRQAGWRVKVVGLSARQSGGIYGLALIPDLTLEQVLPLAPYATCLIIPCTPLSIRQLKNDPRIQSFLEQAYSHQASFVVGPVDAKELETILPTAEFTIYPDSENLVDFARHLAAMNLKRK